MIDKSDIDIKVDDYWDRLFYDLDNIDINRYMDILKGKYGEALEIYESILSDERPLTLAEEKEIYDYAYKTGLYKDYNPIQEYYRKEVLKTLLSTLQNKTIADMGCEDGRITIGLALFGNNKIYGVDMNEYAIEIAEQKKLSYPEIYDKVNFLKASYTEQETYEYMKKNEPEGFDNVLFVQPVRAWFGAREKIQQILKPEGSAIVTMMHIISNPEERLERIRIEGNWGEIAGRAGMSYEILEYRPFYNHKAILIGEMKR